MIELFAYKNAVKNTKHSIDKKMNALRNTVDSSSTVPEDETVGTSSTIDTVDSTVILIYLIIIIWALMRAHTCSSANPDSRAIHYLFAIVSPSIYILLSYGVMESRKD